MKKKKRKPRTPRQLTIAREEWCVDLQLFQPSFENSPEARRCSNAAFELSNLAATTAYINEWKHPR